ncbi:uncharacterized protein LOC125531619, partial [Triticum urartu]|uniref:uncharacterized protein LOC125531619 n=1 Tax=Triticum urartu TaxID=4572 RepID=UPI002043E1A9
LVICKQQQYTFSLFSVLILNVTLHALEQICTSGDVNRDTNRQNSESNIDLEDMDQTFHGNVSEVEDSNIDLTETEASDGMLIDGIRNMLQKSDVRKQERRNVLKKQSRKRSRTQMGAAQQCLNKGRASAYSRFSIGYFAKIVDSVCKSNYRMELVRNAGFGYMLEVDDCHVPRPFAQWIADNVSTTDEAIVLRGKYIPLNAEAVSLVLGIPIGSTPISTLDEEIGKTEFLSLFGLTEVPSISFFGNKLLTEELSNEEYIRCFLTVALATFLCPTSNTKPSTKYMGALVDVSNLRNLNRCSFVHDWGMCYVKKYQKDKKKEKWITTTLGGCIYHLAVCCLDFNNFGAISIPTVMPRICFWKGQTVKHFSDMLIGKDGLYEALEIKHEVETCYAEKDAAWASTAKNSNIRKAIERVLGNSFPDNVKEDIFLNFQERMKDENLRTCLIAKQVLLDTLHIISSSLSGSEETIKLSSQNMHMQTNEGILSGSTVRLDSNGTEINSDHSQTKKRTKRTSQESTTSVVQKAVVQDKIKEIFHGVENGEGFSTPIALSNHVERNKVVEPAAEISTIEIVGTPIHNPEVKTTQAKIHEPTQEQDISENNGPEKSSSLSYMLAANLASVLDTTARDIHSRQEYNEHVAPSFSGFQDNVFHTEQTLHNTSTDHLEGKQGNTPTLGQEEGNIHKGRDHKEEEKELDIDINLPPTNNNPGMPDLKGKSPQDFLHPLDITRRKYFFEDDSIPTCRILEDVDDCGNEILEPDLWLPIWMDTKTYNAKIEVLFSFVHSQIIFFIVSFFI